MRTERICRIEEDGTQTPMVLVPAATVATPEPIKWHKDGQGGFEYADGRCRLTRCRRTGRTCPCSASSCVRVSTVTPPRC